MSEQLQWMADRLAQLAERVAMLEVAQGDALGFPTLLTGNTTIAANYCVVVDDIEVPDGFFLDISGTLMLIG